MQEEKKVIESKDTVTDTANEDGAGESLDNILSSIKDVIKDNIPETDVLELTDKIEEEKPAVSSPDNKSADKSADIDSFSMDSTPNISVDSPEVDSNEMSADSLAIDHILNSHPKDDPQKDAPKDTNISDNKNLLDDRVAEETRAAVSNILKVTKQDHSPRFRAGTTLEDLVIEILKPELKGWLNDNLPALVKSIVEKEVRKLLPKDE